MTTDKLCMCKHALIIQVYKRYTRCSLHFNFTASAYPTVSPTLPCQCNMANPMISVTSQTDIPSLLPQTLTKSVQNYVPVTALGALLALSMVLLAMVTTGWVCTCISMKKREAKQSSTHTRFTSMLIEFGVNNHVDHIY